MYSNTNKLIHFILPIKDTVGMSYSYNFRVYITIWDVSLFPLMKNLNNVSNNVLLILNTYKYIFSFKLLLRIFDVIGQLQPRLVRQTAWK